MPVRDTFSYTARWDSVGLDCAYCTHFSGPSAWPDKQQVSRCRLYDLPLSIELAETGFKEGEWFCRDFMDSGDGRASRQAVEHLRKLETDLRPGVLYCLRGENDLVEFSFEEVRLAAG